jgi:glycosyltransferase involved in cell wall biosynthesis
VIVPAVDERSPGAPAVPASGDGLELDAKLEQPLPDDIAVGAGSALFVKGWCASPDGRRVKRLTIALDGAEHPLMAHGMADRRVGGFGDMWWGIVPLAAVKEPVEMPLTLRAELDAGARTEAQLATLRLVPALDVEPAIPPAPKGDSTRPLVAICMATFEPPLELFAQQIESIRSQTYDNWVCVISDDNSRPEVLAGMREVLGRDERFVLEPSPVRRGFYGNFERALALAPGEAQYLCLADQDDRWHPDKVQVLATELERGAELAYSDTRVVDQSGRVLSDTYWRYRANNYTDFTSLLITNAITGAAALFKRGLADRALPFPPAHGDIYHDHWLALVALATGEIRYVDRPLYDYVQHSGAALGFTKANAGRGRWGGRLADVALRVLRLGYRLIRPVGQLRYFDNYCRLVLQARALEVRFGDSLAPSRRRALRRIQGCDTSPWGPGWLAMRALRPLVGRNETMGMERGLLAGILWRRTASLRARISQKRRRG